MFNETFEHFYLTD